MQELARWPNRTRAPRVSRWFQFGLSYLLYLTVLFSGAFALLRQLLELNGGRWINVTGALCLFAFVAYFAVRVPMLFGRWRRGRRRVAETRAQLADTVERMRSES